MCIDKFLPKKQLYKVPKLTRMCLNQRYGLPFPLGGGEPSYKGECGHESFHYSE